MLFSKEINLPQNADEQLKEAEEILTTLSPLVQNMYKNKALQVLSSGIDYVWEYIFYSLGIACFAFIFIMKTVFPFHVLGEILNSNAIDQVVSSKGDLQTFEIAIKGLILLIGVLLVLIGLVRNSTRKRNNLLYAAGSELKKIEQVFVSKQAIFKNNLPKNDEMQ